MTFHPAHDHLGRRCSGIGRESPRRDPAAVPERARQGPNGVPPNAGSGTPFQVVMPGSIASELSAACCGDL